MPRRGPTIASAALDAIHRRGRLGLDELVDEVVGAGLTRASDPRRAVASAIARSDFIRDWEGRYCSLADQLDGAVFSHAMTGLERRNEIVLLLDDLALVERLAVRRFPAASGGEVHVDLVGDFFELPRPADSYFDDPDDAADVLDAGTSDELLGFMREIGVPYTGDDGQAIAEFLDASRYLPLLHGPAGWLPVLAPDDLLGIRVTGGSVDAVRLRPRDIKGPHVGVVAAGIAKLARLVIGPDPSWFGPPAMTLVELLEIVATEAPELLRRPLPPFSMVVERGGLEVVDGLVGHRGTDWKALGVIPPASPQTAWGFQPSRQLQ